LQKLLASSPDAIVVTNVDRSFVAANPKALDLFGVSETNMKKFTIDAFLLHYQFLYIAGHTLPFKGREKRHGECKIRRLDGSLRVAEYIFVANVVPNRHLCRFRNVKMAQLKSIATSSSGHGSDSNTGLRHWGHSEIEAIVACTRFIGSKEDSAKDGDAALAAPRVSSQSSEGKVGRPNPGPVSGCDPGISKGGGWFEQRGACERVLICFPCHACENSNIENV
jgi:PAS domain S-box-containing protein